MKLQPFQNRTWAEIDLNASEHNFKVIRSHLNDNTKLCCVVKANGYGHGAIQLSKLFEELGADYLAVSNIEEAIQLRKGNITLPILILGYTDPRCAIDLSCYNISQCVFSYEYGCLLSKYAQEKRVKVGIHIKLDTGMGRIGFKCISRELDKASEVCLLKGLNVEGVFTHFASADEGDNGTEYTIQQFNKFMDSISYLESQGIYFSIKHCANSATIFDYPDMQLDMVRAGIVLYGLQPSNVLHNPGNIIPILTLKTIIDHVKEVFPGECISYGREFKAEHMMRVATIPIGYADGLWRSNFQNHLEVEVEGKMVPVIGRICMDQCMIDITNVHEAHINSVVTVYGSSGLNSIDFIADANKTINYELVCSVGERVPRVYKKDKVAVAVVDNIV